MTIASMSAQSMTELSVEISDGGAADDQMQSGTEVQAWARDTVTGEPRYIMELGSDRRGKQCRCDCPSCALPLVAVNAARTAWRRRPHFRHPAGAGTSACSVLTARLAALRTLRDLGTLQLPRRTLGARFVGLSGHFHDASVNVPSEIVRIRDVNFHDRIGATLVLEDGRRLAVRLTGSLSVDEGGQVATICLQVSDALVATMSPEELRQRLLLELDERCWVEHWQDDALCEAAGAAARREAQDRFDIEIEGQEWSEGASQELRRETLLHLEVKRILEAAGELMLPGVPSHGHGEANQWLVPAQRVAISDARLEVRLGRVVPDVACCVTESSLGPLQPLLVEVTVTNGIGGERLERIKSTGFSALEIDLRKVAGTVTRPELERLVVDEVVLKKWLHLARSAREEVEAREMSLQQDPQLLKGPVCSDAWAELRSPQAPAKTSSPSLREAGQWYLSVVERFADSRSVEFGLRSNAEVRRLDAELTRAQLALAHLGFPEVSDARLDDTHGIIPRILSIKLGRGVGYRYADTFSVLNAISQTVGTRTWEVTIYLIAMSIYKPTLSASQYAKFDEWSKHVRESINRGELQYVRRRKFDHLLSALFPEMKTALAAQSLHSPHP